MYAYMYICTLSYVYTDILIKLIDKEKNYWLCFDAEQYL